MAIQFDCSACGRPLSVSDPHDGTQVQCPQCGAVLPVPAVAITSPAAQASTRWSLRIPEGKVYGPIERAELDQWVAEGRLDGNCMLQAEGETTWLHAVHEYPHLQLHPRSPTSMAAPQGTSTAYIQPHRGGILLTFGILGIMSVTTLLCFPFGLFFGVLVGLFSPVAWLMSHKDLKAIRAGRMDLRGEGPAKAGRVLGIVGTIMFAVYLLLILVIFAFMFFAAGQGPGGPFGPGF